MFCGSPLAAALAAAQQQQQLIVSLSETLPLLPVTVSLAVAVKAMAR